VTERRVLAALAVAAAILYLAAGHFEEHVAERSDTLIAIDRFRVPLPGAPYAIILLYWAGPAGIAASARGPSAGGR
jgi:hypothetical protein